MGRTLAAFLAALVVGAVLPAGPAASPPPASAAIVGPAPAATPSPASPGTASPGTTPASGHVFVIMLENESASKTFGPNSPAPYLSKTLRAEGAYLPDYYGIGHQSNDNYVAMISGQAPNAENQADCPDFHDILPGTIGAYGQVRGTGCVYPAGVQTVANQLDQAGLTWRSYNEDMGADPSRESATCAHPRVGFPDNTQKATKTDEYAARHDPFVYFHSIIDDSRLCDTHVVNLNLLPQDLASAASTPSYAFITPDLCDDGHDAPCANGQPGGLAQADSFLREWVPQITESPAFRTQNGLLIITFDEASTSDASSCCGEIPGPGSPKPGAIGPGGGRVGAVLLSPCIAPGTVSHNAYNHYAMLRSVEDLFGLSHLGYAALPGEQSFGSDVFTGACGTAPRARIRAPALASRVATRPRVTVSWGTAGAGAVTGFTIQVRRAGGRGARWRTLLRATTERSLDFRGRLGSTYTFRVRAIGAAGLVGHWATARTVMPSGVAIAGGRYVGPWRRVHRRGAWLGRSITCASGACSFSLSYRGGTVAIIGGRGPGGGRARVTLDGRTKTVSLHSRHRSPRQVLYRRHVRARRRHELTITVLSGVVSLEGFGILR